MTLHSYRCRPAEFALRSRAVITFALGVMLTWPTLSPAQHPAGPTFSIHDTNGDGAIDAQEYGRLQQRMEAYQWALGRHPHRHPSLLPFAALDGDGDGLITLQELERSLYRAREQRRLRLHHNHPQATNDKPKWP